MAKEWELGDTSQRYETGGRGAGTISTGKGDHGGVSYGSYQLSSKTGTLREYLDQSPYGDRFTGLTPATPAFNEKWRELAKSDPGFGRDQHEFIQKSHYDVQIGKLEKRGIDLSDRGPAVQDALWSTSVQFRNLTPGIVEKGLKEKFGPQYKLDQLNDKQIVEAIQDYKINHNEQLFSKSPKLWDSLEQRARNEKADLVKLADREQTVGERTQGDRAHPAGANKERAPGHSAEDTARTREAQEALNQLGIKDARGKPLEVDGKMGPHTREAVEAFQKENHLPPTGKLDLQTSTAVVAAAEQHKQQGPKLSDAAHPDNAMYKQALDGIQKLGPQSGLNDEQKRNAAATLTYEAKVSGLDRIDHVVASPDGKRMFAVEGQLQDPAHKRVITDTAQAAAQPVEKSTRALEQDMPTQTPPPVQPNNEQQNKPMQH
ncbi:MULTISPECIES: peptidoglycan-binding domain-containing protein [unclassified Lysobacter]|uniref:peptidoglycan-binding domain-containing protein n=1 Tax=unclassified Lysobacter TaxID=2635362 RepID=UPI001BEC2245|nr:MULTISPECIES: peptidoglycan-binding domain-containing protein [unclassified Lysobacter]MBT2749125.1 peptidoglycan-binding protein [Lysobacter sp. ISL-42]MBT2754214.1 peptidoglycan-binding protein [Lysobacter sp. ISL-50]MBT2779570.1 peptidoglycan-binding protein [Lysobacter sp. ISL-54]MBT2784337.1 peptidoglycan-binding protein [Lysobacter sp. ISL-52]